jgi:hypothetical protein
VLRTEDPLAQLGQLLASRGVPPFLVAANIMEDNYRSVRLWKENGCILVETTCMDDETGTEQVYLYRYDKDAVLQTIEMQVCGHSDLIWNRRTEIENAARTLQASVSRVPAATGAPW